MAVIERQAQIVNPLGMHARPAAEFVKTASRFNSAIHVSKDGLSVNGKSIMGVMMLAAERGSSMSIRADGEDAERAMEALLELVAAGFNEMHLTGSDADLEDVEDDEPGGTARA
jgi:phosphocarrier protein HPr